MNRGTVAKIKFTSNGNVVSTSAMFIYYHPAIISPMKRIANEFTISFVIITWYIGTVIGSFIAIHLHTINRSKSELVLVSWFYFRNKRDWFLFILYKNIDITYIVHTIRPLTPIKPYFHTHVICVCTLYMKPRGFVCLFK